MNKRILQILSGTLLLFGIITLATSSLKYDADGADEYGFPFNFYTKVSGYNLNTQLDDTVTEFKAFALIGNIIFALVLSIIGFLVMQRFRKSNKA